jgi:glucose/arabinose dehydrogenase
VAWRSGDDASYIVNQSGTVVRFGGGSSTTVLDVSDLITSGGERGLLGLAFAPAGDLAYVNYTDRDGNTTVVEYPVDPDGHFRAGDEARTVLFVEQPYANHNGGDLVFGPDGMLYIGMGDGGSGGDPERRATNPGDLLGKMLRIDPTPSGTNPYTVPPDNPFVDTPGWRPEIWSSGLRNPWRYSFDRQTGDLWIADVGQGAIEEVDVAPATDGKDAGRGLYFGWSAFEGDDRYNTDVSPDGATPPFVTYTHGPGCSVSGGVRVRGGPVPDLVGWYVYGDYCSGDLWAVEVLGEGASMRPGRQVELGNVPSLAEVVEGPDGEVYAVSLQGAVLRLDPPG